MQLKEFSTQQLQLESEELAYLLDLVHGSSADTEDSRVLQALTPTRVPGLYELRAGPFVGRLGLPSGRWIDFISRFDFEDVIELIRMSGRTPIRTDLLRVEASPASFIIDAVAIAFTREVERLLVWAWPRATTGSGSYGPHTRAASTPHTTWDAWPPDPIGWPPWPSD
jgi:hypothetical protein